MDHIDKKILAYLQEDASISIGDLADKVTLSTTPCWRRIQKLEKNGVIEKRVALVNAAKIGLGLSVFVHLKTSEHNAAWLAKFATAVSAFPEVIEFYRMSGEWDYLLRVVVQGVPAYDRFYKKLIATADLTDVTSSFAMEQIKYTTSLPLPDDAD